MSNELVMQTTPNAPPPEGYLRVVLQSAGGQYGFFNVRPDMECPRCAGAGVDPEAAKVETDDPAKKGAICVCIAGRLQTFMAQRQHELAERVRAGQQAQQKVGILNKVHEEIATLQQGKATALAPLQEKVDEADRALKETQSAVRGAEAERDNLLSHAERCDEEVARLRAEVKRCEDAASDYRRGAAQVDADVLPQLLASENAATERHAGVQHDYQRVANHWDRKLEKKQRTADRLKRRIGPLVAQAVAGEACQPVEAEEA